MNNSWIDLPVVEAIEYFGGVLAQAYKWANRYAILFGLVGIIWSGYKVMMSRMTVKDFWWDTLFKWIGFLLLMELYPTMTIGFSAVGNQIGMNAGGGKQVIIDGLKNLRSTITQDLEAQKAWSEGLSDELNSKFDGLTLTTKFENSESYSDYMDKVSDEIGAFKFSSGKDKKAAQSLVDQYKEKEKYSVMFSAQTLNALNSVLVEKNLDGTDGDNLTNTYVDLDIFLRDAEGNDTYYISPSALLKVALLSCQIMFEKENTVFNKVSDDIANNDDLGFFDKALAQIGHQFSRIPQMIMCFFCCIVLILATVFAEIQYTMTILEYTIVVGIGAIFIPLMLFDGTKDIPKKLIPVFISFLVKIIVITICVMFVYYLIIENCVNTIADDGGMNWTAVGEIVFEAALCYILTQNAPKIAQTILTGQPQLSMGEALQGAGTTAATIGGMKAVASGAARTAYNKGSSAVGEGKKIHAAAKAASGAVGDLVPNATKGQKFKAAVKGGMSAASADLKERTKARMEKFNKSHSSIPVLDKAVQMTGIKDSPAGAGGGAGGSGGGNAHGISGQGNDAKPYSAVSNPSFSSATKYDAKTNSQRSMTHAEFNAEKKQQGQMIGSEAGLKYAQKIEEQNKRKAEKEKNEPLPDKLTDNERPVV